MNKSRGVAHLKSAIFFFVIQAWGNLSNRDSNRRNKSGGIERAQAMAPSLQPDVNLKTKKLSTIREMKRKFYVNLILSVINVLVLKCNDGSDCTSCPICLLYTVCVHLFGSLPHASNLYDNIGHFSRQPTETRHRNKTLLWYDFLLFAFTEMVSFFFSLRFSVVFISVC